MQSWIFEDVAKLPSWAKISAAEADNNLSAKKSKLVKDTEAQMINTLTKDIEVFVNGSWCFPYLIVVPVNTISSAFILGNMYGSVILVCYLAMFLLLLLQYFSNKVLATLQYEKMQLTDQRIGLLKTVIRGIRQVKLRLQENEYI